MVEMILLLSAKILELQCKHFVSSEGEISLLFYYYLDPTGFVPCWGCNSVARVVYQREVL